MCQAYCAYAFAHPGQYRVLFGTKGVDGRDLAEMPGLDTFAVFRDEIAAHVADGTEVAVCLWAFLHGVVMLRLDRPSFPWPSLDALIARELGAHFG